MSCALRQSGPTPLETMWAPGWEESWFRDRREKDVK